MLKSVSVLRSGLVSCLALAGCGSDASHRKLDLPRAEIAVVRGVDDGFVLMGPSRLVEFISVDGENVDGGFWKGAPKEVDVRPGKHTLGVRYKLRFSAGAYGPSGETTIELDAEAGKVYQTALVVPESGGVRVLVAEVGAGKQ